MARGGPTPKDFRPALFRDREDPTKWRIERLLDDGETYEVHVFSPPNAKQKARKFAMEHYDDYDEIELEPYRRRR